MGGKTGCRAIGFEMLSPSLTELWTSRMAADIRELFTVSETTSNDCRIGTPELDITPKTREKRARAVFWNSGPNTGTRSLKRSHSSRPCFVLMNRRDRKG